MARKTPMAREAQKGNPTCPEGHPLDIVDDGEFLFGECATCKDAWRVMFDGKVIPHGHPLG